MAKILQFSEKGGGATPEGVTFNIIVTYYSLPSLVDQILKFL